MLRLERISVRGFKAIDRFSMSLEPSLTVLLGMNGAGKSSILQVFSLMRHLAEGTPSRFFDERGWDPKSLRFRTPTNRSWTVRIQAIFSSERWGRLRWTVRWELNSGSLRSERVELRRASSSEPADVLVFDKNEGGRAGSQELPSLHFKGSLLSAVQHRGRSASVIGDLLSWLTKIQSLELLSPTAMKGGTRRNEKDMGARGDHLAGFLASLKPRQRSRVVSRVGRFYPLDNLQTVRKRAGWIDLILSEQFSAFGSIPSTQMSDGFMRLLALCAIPELPDVSIVLLDEIEDGIEPHILGRLITLVTQETDAQIVATSHSPIIANVVGAPSLRLISRAPDGRSVAAEVDEMPAFRVGRDYLGPGELWANTDLSVLESEALGLAEFTEAEEL